jgi:hypothetical protein
MLHLMSHRLTPATVRPYCLFSCPAYPCLFAPAPSLNGWFIIIKLSN